MYIMISKGPKRSETPVWNPWHFSLHPTHYNLKKKKKQSYLYPYFLSFDVNHLRAGLH